jgi:hypothetical protein
MSTASHCGGSSFLSVLNIGTFYLQNSIGTVVFSNNVVQGDQEVSVYLMITIEKFTSNVKVSPASLQAFIDTPNCVLEDRV